MALQRLFTIYQVNGQLNRAICGEAHFTKERPTPSETFDWRQKARKDARIFFARKYHTPLIFNGLDYGHQRAYFRLIRRGNERCELK